MQPARIPVENPSAIPDEAEFGPVLIERKFSGSDTAGKCKNVLCKCYAVETMEIGNKLFGVRFVQSSGFVG
jgi:hypothetical protein